MKKLFFIFTIILLIASSLLAQSRITSGCDLPDLNLYLEDDGSVFYHSSQAIGGFQFNVDGTTVSSGSGGDMAANGLFGSAGGNTFLAFSFTGGSIPAGCGTLVELVLDGDASGLSGIVVSDTQGTAIPFVYYSDMELVADCTDEYPDCAANEIDCAGDCGGTAELDDCGVCNGGTQMISAVDVVKLDHLAVMRLAVQL